MKRQREGRGQSRLLIDSPQSGTKRLLKTGVLSLLFHIILIVSMILNLKSAIPKSGLTVYRVTIRSESSIPLTLLGETQIEKEENKSIQEIKQRRPVFNNKNLDQEIPSAQSVAMGTPLEEQKLPPRHQEEEEGLKEPIPLPMAVVPDPNADLSLRNEDSLSTLLPPSRFEEKYQNNILESVSGNGGGTGQGGPGGGSSGKGSGGVRGSFGDGLGPGGESSGFGGSRKVAGIRQGGYGGGSGDGSGSERGCSGTVGSRKGGEIGRAHV